MEYFDQSAQILEDECKKEISKFHTSNNRASPACYELFRRALSDDDMLALQLIMELYNLQMRNWVTKHDCFWLMNEPAEDLISIAFSKFYFKVKGDTFKNFPSVGALLKYLKLCVHSAIMQAFRKNSQVVIEPIEFAESVRIVGHANKKSQEFKDLWEYICSIVTDPVDRLLMRCAFVYDMKPAEITNRYPEHWETARDVSLALFKIRSTLRNDDRLQNW